MCNWIVTIIKGSSLSINLVENLAAVVPLYDMQCANVANALSYSLDLIV